MVSANDAAGAHFASSRLSAEMEGALGSARRTLISPPPCGRSKPRQRSPRIPEHRVARGAIGPFTDSTSTGTRLVLPMKEATKRVEGRS